MTENLEMRRSFFHAVVTSIDSLVTASFIVTWGTRCIGGGNLDLAPHPLSLPEFEFHTSFAVLLPGLNLCSRSFLRV